MRYTCLKEFKYQDGRGNWQTVRPGDFADLSNRHLVERLLKAGAIRLKAGGPEIPVSLPSGDGLNILLWMLSTPWYSGGRLHGLQAAWALAHAGHRVTVLTNQAQKWHQDYPRLGNLRFEIMEKGRSSVAAGADVVMALPGGSETFMAGALEYSRRWDVPLAYFVFETPNWVETLVPSYARRLKADHLKRFYGAADFVIANSQCTAGWFKEWLGKEKRVVVLPPCVNSFAAEAASAYQGKRPYAVISSRGSAYKNVRVAIEAIASLKRPFDLWVVGRTGSARAGHTGDHRVHIATGCTDKEKFGLIAGAHMVLAPSLFEGFGMVPAEALWFGKPVVVYDLPVLHQNYGGRLIYAEHGDAKDFVRKAVKVAETAPASNVEHRDWARKTFSMEAMEERATGLPYCFSRRFGKAGDVKISAGMIVYANASTVEASLRSVYEHVEQIVIVYGPTERWKDYPADGTLELIRAFRDPLEKISIYMREVWKDKTEMRNFYARRLEGTHQLELDADEIWVGLEAWKDYVARTKLRCAAPRWVNFWHSTRHWIIDVPTSGGSRWGKRGGAAHGTYLPHFRFGEWRPSYRFRTHVAPVDATDSRLFRPDMNRHDFGDAALVYHFGHALDGELAKKKFDFYSQRDSRDGALKRVLAGKEARRKVWNNWKGKTGNCGDGIVLAVDWELPEVVVNANK